MKKCSKIVFESCDDRIGYRSRKTTLGPEWGLVENFVDTGISELGHTDRRNKLAIFVEPSIDSGFPDLVLAEFRPDSYRRWVEDRNNLTTVDLKILALLYDLRGSDVKSLQSTMGVRPSVVLKSLDRLCNAGLIIHVRKTRRWAPVSLSKTFGIDRLIAIEAKVSNKQEVVEQAALDLWFASESYTLTQARPASMFRRRVRQAGVGIMVMTHKNVFRRYMGARKFSIPHSYASWQFNEWIGRRLNLNIR